MGALLVEFVVYLFFVYLVGRLAERRGRRTRPWVWFAFFLSPLLAGIALVVLEPIPVPFDEAIEKGCPDCAESVLVDARVCRHCGYRFDSSSAAEHVDRALRAP